MRTTLLRTAKRVALAALLILVGLAGLGAYLDYIDYEPNRPAATVPADPSVGACRSFDAGVVVCVPAGEHGAPVRIEEDGMARYADGWTYDSQTATYQPPAGDVAAPVEVAQDPVYLA